MHYKYVIFITCWKIYLESGIIKYTISVKLLIKFMHRIISQFILCVPESTDRSPVAQSLFSIHSTSRCSQCSCLTVLLSNMKPQRQVCRSCEVSQTSIWSEDTRHYSLYGCLCMGYIAFPSWQHWELWQKDWEPPTPSTEDAAHPVSFMRAGTWSLHLQVGNKLCQFQISTAGSERWF